MKKFTVLMIILFLTFNLIKAQIASFNFNATPYISASANNANLIVNNIQLSTGTISTNITTGSYFTNEPYIEASGGWTATSALTAKYFYVNITAQAGYRFSLTNISFDMYATAAGPSGASILLDNTSIHTTNVSSAALQSISKPIEGYTKLTYVTLKIAGWNNGSRATAGTGILKIDNLIINGLVELIPPNDSSSSIMPTSFSIPNVISSVTNNAFIPVMELAIVDSATADGISTFIDSLKIKAGLNNQFTNFTEIISQASWVCNNYADTVKGVISNNSITFHTPSFEIPEGLLNTDTCRLLIALKKNLPNADGKKLGFVLDSTHVFCKPSGSKVGWGKVDTGIDNLKVQVLATRLSVNLEPDLVWKDSLFQIKIEAVDSYGNLDTDENGNVGVVLDKGEGVLQSATSLSSFFIQGKALFNGLKFTGSDTISLKMQSTKFEDYLISDHLVGKPLFIDDFESAMLSTWKNTNDWTVSTLNPISNAHSLKHNLSGVEGYSYLTSEYFSPVMNHGKTVWRMVLKNGNFDPTSTNRFWYFLMASDSNLLSTNNYGYAVGVNFSGSNDTLSLWKLDSTGTKTILLSSNFEWNENETVAVEVIREVSGSWRIGYSESSDFDNLNYSARFNENTFVDLPYHGLVFQYSNTRSGLLWVDNISVFQLNTPPTMTKVKVIQADTVLLYFSEPLNQTEAVIISNYKIFSESDKEVYLLGLRFDVNQPNCVKLAISNLKTAQYTIHSSNLKDMDGSIMLPDSLSFSYEVPAKLADVVFTEIMFDPSPSAGLPETDYLEIYNRSKNPINLNGWKLNIGGLIKTFPDTVIREGEYITLSNAAFSKQFAEFGKFIGLISITELTNLGKAVRLISNTGLLIDSIFYRPYWITDEQKLDGGWSLERIDPNNCCGESVNWNVSNNPKGGTPGAVNSISKPNLDTFSPHLIKWNQLSMRHLEFYFNEEIDAKSLNKNYFLGLSSSVDIVDSLVLSSNLKTVSIYLSDSIKPDRKYEFTLSHFSDLCGNTFSDTVLEFLHHPIVQYDIVFNEIMSDAEPSK